VPIIGRAFSSLSYPTPSIYWLYFSLFTLHSSLFAIHSLYFSSDLFQAHRQIKLDVIEIIEREKERIANDPELRHLVEKEGE